MRPASEQAAERNTINKHEAKMTEMIAVTNENNHLGTVVNLCLYRY
jgi:hypothetical protein